MATPNSQLTTLTLGDTADAWRTAGFEVGAGGLKLGSTRLVLSGSGAGFEGWRLEGIDQPLDGLAVTPDAGWPGDAPSEHPNGISRIDHIVVQTGDSDRTVARFVEAGLMLRRTRRTTTWDRPTVQSFFWAGDVIIEVVGPEPAMVPDRPGSANPASAEPTSIFGLALVSDDIDRTAEHLGDLLGPVKDAVQPGRRIAGLRHRQVGISLPIAVMSPHVRFKDPVDP